MRYMIFFARLRTGSDPAEIKRFQNYPGNIVIQYFYIFKLRLETVHADNFVTFNCDERTAGVVLAARKQLDLVIQSKLSDPRQVFYGI